ncbi:MAG: hypothetical protein OHK0047_27750 [Leptolyngbyaceae cyanobacterium]|jgi:hypothetical protein
MISSRQYSAEFNAKVVLQVLSGEKNPVTSTPRSGSQTLKLKCITLAQSLFLVLNILLTTE